MPCWVLNMELRANPGPTEPTSPAPITANIGTPNRNPSPIGPDSAGLPPHSPPYCVCGLTSSTYFIQMEPRGVGIVLASLAQKHFHPYNSMDGPSFFSVTTPFPFHDVHAWVGYSLRQRPPPMEGLQGHLVRSRRGIQATFANKLSSSVH